MHRWPFLNAEEKGGPHRGKKRRCKKRIRERKRYSGEKPQKKKKKREKRMRLIITIREGRRAICPSWLHFGVLGKRHEFALFCRSFLIRLGRPRTIVLVLREMSLKIFFKGKHLLVDFLNSATEKE